MNIDVNSMYVDMDPCDIISVQYFFGGEFLRVGPVLQYIGGDEAMSEIERDKLSLVELKAFLADHTSVKDSMKFYFLIPGKELLNGLLFLSDDVSCMKMSDYTTEGGVAEVFVEYHDEEDEQDSENSNSDFEDEIGIEDAPEDIDASEPEAVITADDYIGLHDDIGAICSVIRSPAKLNMHRISTAAEFQRREGFESGQSSQGAMTGSSQVLNPNSQAHIQTKFDRAEKTGRAVVVEVEDSDSDSEDSDYVPASDDSGEDDETVQLRKFAKLYKKKLRDSQRFVESDASGAVPIDLMANIEEAIEHGNIEAEYDSGSEDFSYDEDEEGNIIRKRTKYPTYDPNTDTPHFSLGMVFKSKTQFRKAVIKYGLKTYRNIKFIKSEDDRVRAKCAWPGCPWLMYGVVSSRCSRFQVITYSDDHHCAPNRVNSLVSARIIAKRYEHFLLANPTWKISSMQCTILCGCFSI